MKPGTIGWIDMTVPGADTVCEFYEKVVGWEHDDCDMGGYSDYAMKPPGGESVAGICHARGPNVGLPACWLIYINVADLDASMAQATARGGKVLHGPRSAGGTGRMCVIQDPAGAAVALFEPK